MKSVPSLSAASAPENVTPFGPFVLCTARGSTTSPLWLLSGYSLTSCCCTFTYTLNNERAIKHAGDTEIAYLWRGRIQGCVAPAQLWSVTTCKPECEGMSYMWDMCSGEQIPATPVVS